MMSPTPFPVCGLRARWLLVSVAALALTAGCGLFDGDDGPIGGDDDDDMMVVRDGGPEGVDGVSRGEPCGEDRRCRTGLVCETTCEPPGNRPEGASCQQTGDCEDGLWCTALRTCEAAGDGEDGDDCGGTAECAAGLVCVPEVDLGRRCRPAGDTDLGFFCETTLDCYAGLACLPSPTDGAFRCLEPPETLGAPCESNAECMGLLCLPDPADPDEDVCRGPGDGPLGEPPLFPPTWAGADCPDPVDGETVAHFRVPRSGDDDEDFYRLPYPNDIRRRESGLDLSGHPSPGTVLPIDLVGRYVETAEQDLDGFAVNAAVWFRFSAPVALDSLRDPDAGNAPRLRLVDLDDPGAPDEPIQWLWTSGSVTRYVCNEWVGVRTRSGRPLREGRTYAVIVERGVTTQDEPPVPFERASDFEAMLAGDPPTGDAPLADAWTAYAPLRSWIADAGEDAGRILNAAVFTTQTFSDDVPAMRAAIADADPPAPSDLTLCGSGVTSPCAVAGERDCLPARDEMDVVHGRLDLPQFQEGTLPFEDEGGAIARDAESRPEVVRRDDVCFALTVPKGVEAPETGWPLVVYLHGTGGGIQSAQGSGYAQALAAPEEGQGPPAATLTIDLPMHGDRRGGSTRPPKDLFFNYVNPRASRDSVLQGTADFFSVVRAATVFDVDAAASPTGGPLRFDPDRIVLFAHSQGATHGALAIPHEPGIRAAILSGVGGDLTQALLHKRAPVDVAALLPLGLLDASREDGRLRVGAFHPALGLFQTVMERTDPVNYAGLYRPPGVADGRHVFMTYGLGDTFTPVETQDAFARAGFLTIVRQCDGADCDALVSLPPLLERDPPLASNVDFGAAGQRTVGLRQYEPPDGVDGHFVAWRNGTGLTDTLRFLRDALGGDAPRIGEDLP